MALNKTLLQNQIYDLLNSSFNQTENGQDVRQIFANQLAEIIDLYVKSARITIPQAGIVTNGNATTQTNISPIILESAIS